MPATLIPTLAAIIFCSGTRLFLNDGNFIEVDSYTRKGEIIGFEHAGRKYSLPASAVNMGLTEKLKAVEKEGVILSLPDDAEPAPNDILEEDIKTRRIKQIKRPVNKGLSLRVGTGSAPQQSSFFNDIQPQQNQVLDPVERMKQRGVMFKLQLPIKDD